MQRTAQTDLVLNLVRMLSEPYFEHGQIGFKHSDAHFYYYGGSGIARCAMRDVVLKQDVGPYLAGTLFEVLTWMCDEQGLHLLARRPAETAMPAEEVDLAVYLSWLLVSPGTKLV